VVSFSPSLNAGIMASEGALLFSFTSESIPDSLLSRLSSGMKYGIEKASLHT
jgi:hypothetical protein